jgi:hypothetical protein
VGTDGEDSTDNTGSQIEYSPSVQKSKPAGSVRRKVGAVMRLTSLTKMFNDKEKGETDEETGTRTPSESDEEEDTANNRFDNNLTPSGSNGNLAEAGGNDTLGKSHATDMMKLQKLMKKKDMKKSAESTPVESTASSDTEK